ncbi:MAG: hypothetical protein M3O31_15470 [Acidobacteriota bacterium]|nr:hypothetical protein [Acidobacteriota bacterium]
MNSRNTIRSVRWGLSVMLSVMLAPQPHHQLLGQVPDQDKTNGSETISITGVPHSGQGGPEATEPISGLAKGVKVTKFKVVVYAYAGGTWWVQPTVAAPLTDIDNAGNWETDTHLGSSYAALLVKQSFKPAATLSALPTAHGEIIAVVRVAGTK